MHIHPTAGTIEGEGEEEKEEDTAVDRKERTWHHVDLASEDVEEDQQGGVGGKGEGKEEEGNIRRGNYRT